MSHVAADEKAYDEKVLADIRQIAKEGGIKLSDQEVQDSLKRFKSLQSQLGLPEALPVEHHHEPTLRQDPAIERWRVMRDHIHQGFRFTRYNTGPAIFYAAIVPVAFFGMAYATKDRWSWAGKGRGESLLKRSPQEPSSSQ